MERTARGRVVVAVAVAGLLAGVVSGCSFSWDDAGIEDVRVAGRTPADLAPAPVPADPGEAAEAAKKAEEEAERKLRRVAVFPVAYADAAGSLPCDLCPESFAMQPTSAATARLATGFLYEAITAHPRLLFPPFKAVEAALAASPNRSMKAAASALAAAGKAEYVVVAALGELRPRVGPDDKPERPAGVRLWMGLLQARTGEVVWQESFDEDETQRNFLFRTYDRIANDVPVRYHTVEGFTETAIDELVVDMVDELD